MTSKDGNKIVSFYMFLVYKSLLILFKQDQKWSIDALMVMLCHHGIMAFYHFIILFSFCHYLVTDDILEMVSMRNFQVESRGAIASNKHIF